MGATKERPPAQKTADGSIGEAGGDFRTELMRLLPQVRAFAHFLCRDRAAADDLAQEALMRAWAARNSFQPGSHMRAWLFVIVRNSFYSDQRKAWRAVALDADTAERTLRQDSVQTEALDLDDVRRALQRLPQDQREAIILVAAGGLSYEETAQICQCAVGTIKSRVNRARKALIDIIDSGQIPAPDEAAQNALELLIADAKRLATDK